MLSSVRARKGLIHGGEIMADDKKDEGGTYEDIKGSGGFLTGIPNVTSDTFTGTNNETGEKEEVVAWDAEHAAEKFSEGKGEPKK